jgi:hypothetical protein
MPSSLKCPRSRKHNLRTKNPISLEPSRWSPRYLAILGIRLAHGAQFDRLPHPTPQEPHPTDILQLQPIKQLRLSTIGEFHPDDLGMDEYSEIYWLFANSHELESRKACKGYRGHWSEVAHLYARMVISYVFSEVFVDGGCLVYADSSDGKQSEL